MTNEPDVNVTLAGQDDLRRTATMHVTELPHGLFPRLGRRFVRRWHGSHLDSEHGILVVARDGGTTVGFLLGTTDRRANVEWIMTRHRRELLISGSLAMLARPWLIASFIRSRGRRYARRILRPGGSPKGTPSRAGDAIQAGAAPPEQIAVLEAVVVDYSSRGKGIGTALVNAFVAQVAAAGVDRVELVTKADARGAARFYERSGWQRVGGHVDRDGDEVFTYRFSPQVADAR